MKGNFRIKTFENGRSLLNLGCGFKTDWNWTNVDFCLYARLAHHKEFAKILRRIGLLSEVRYQRLLGIDPDIIIWNLAKGVPFPDQSFDAVYHSHLLEHFDRNAAASFLRQCQRVMKTGGIIRVVVPDLQFYVNGYISSVSRLEKEGRPASDDHQKAIYDLLDPLVRKGFAGEERRNPLARVIERFVQKVLYAQYGLHQWMYDRHSLKAFLSEIGFKDIREECPSKSRIRGWSQFNLDHDNDNKIYKPESIYMEGVK